MSSYPAAVYSPRAKTNYPGVVYHADQPHIGYAEDVTFLDGEVVAIETELGANPKGAKADVKTRLDDVDSAIGLRATQADFTAHTGNTSNPHSVTKAQVGLTSVTDDEQLKKADPVLGGELVVGNYNIKLGDSPGNGASSGIIDTLTAGVTVAFGEVCAIAATGKLAKAQADAIANSAAFAMALEAKNPDQACRVLLLGIVTNSGLSFTAGNLVYLSAATAGAITTTAPSGANNVIQLLGVMLSATKMYFMPSLVQVEHV